MSESVGSVYVDVLPDARKFGPELKAKLRDLSVDVGLNVDDKAFRAKVDEVTRERSATVRVNADAGKANAEIDAAARDRTTRVKVKADKSALSELRSMLNPGGMGLLGSTVLGLGPALIPVTAALGGITAALGAPIAAAGGGVTVGALIAGAAVKQTSEQIKQIGQLQKKVETAQQSLASARASASTSAANSLASAQRSRDNSITSARASLASATTPAGRAAAERRIASAEAAFSARQASVTASQNARIATAQRQVTQATQAYRTALKGLSPEQRKYMDAQVRLKTSFGNLIRTAGPEILGPVVKGMDALSKVMPHIKPLLDGVSHGIEVLLTDATKFASSSGFSSFIKSFGSLADTSIVSFGRDLENLAVGSGRLLNAFSPLTTSVMKGLEGMTSRFAEWAGHVGDSSTFHHFLTYVQQEGPKVGQFIGDIAVAAANIARAMAPWGSVVLAGLDGFANFIRNAKPGTIEALATAIGGLALAAGKGPLGLATAVGAVMVHSPGFVSFLRTAGRLAGDFADAFNKLPESVQMAAAAAVGVGAIGLKLKGTGLLGGKGGGGLISSALGIASKKSPVPVIVMNPGALGAGGVPPGTAEGAVTAGFWSTLWKGFKNGLKPGAGIKGLGITNEATGLKAVMGLGKLGWLPELFGGSKDVYTPKDRGMVPLGLDGKPITGKYKWYDEVKGGADRARGSVKDLDKTVSTFHRSLMDLPNVDVHVRIPELPHDLAMTKSLREHLDALHSKNIHVRVKELHDSSFGPHAKAMVPYGATGGIVTRPTIAKIGEAGPEAVIPLNRTPGSSPLPKGLGGGLHIGEQHIHGVDYQQWKRDQEHDVRVAAMGGADFR